MSRRASAKRAVKEMATDKYVEARGAVLALPSVSMHSPHWQIHYAKEASELVVFMSSSSPPLHLRQRHCIHYFRVRIVAQCAVRNRT